MSEQIGPGPDNYGEGYLDKLDAKLKPRIDALQASEKNVFDNQFDAIRKTYAYLQSRLTAAEKERDELKREADSLLCDVSQLLDGWHNDGTSWTEWDESVRKRVSELHKKVARAELYKLKGTK